MTIKKRKKHEDGTQLLLLHLQVKTQEYFKVRPLKDYTLYVVHDKEKHSKPPPIHRSGRWF